MTIDLYHITHINNLASILESDALLAYNQLKQKKYINIAYHNIQDRRSLTKVPCAKGGTLHDYVPFYFAPRSPMLFTINKGNVEGYKDGQSSILHLVVNLDKIANSNIAFTFTDGHAIMNYSDFYDDLNALEYVIDWELMESRYWFDTEEDSNRKCRRQAEFLIYQFCPWEIVREIGVINNSIAQQVKQVLQQYNDLTPVKVYPNWYY